MNDEDRRRVLERRARFLGATLCGVTAGALLGACDGHGPVCRSLRRNLPSAFAKAVGCAPTVCLSVAIVDAGTPRPLAPVDAGSTSDASSEEP
ncbi:MAG: hypothetical protein U0263_19265 [Polyangiaceae bacterium]